MSERRPSHDTERDGGAHGDSMDKPGWNSKSWVSLIPNGIGQVKPNHYADISVRKESTAQQTARKNESVNLQITIHEGPRYFVRRTEVMANEETNHGVVMRAAGLRPGEPYNPNRIAKWIEGLNRLRRFEPVKREDIVVELGEARTPR